MEKTQSIKRRKFEKKDNTREELQRFKDQRNEISQAGTSILAAPIFNIFFIILCTYFVANTVYLLRNFSVLAIFDIGIVATFIVLLFLIKKEFTEERRANIQLLTIIEYIGLGALLLYSLIAFFNVQKAFTSDHLSLGGQALLLLNVAVVYSVSIYTYFVCYKVLKSSVAIMDTGAVNLTHFKKAKVSLIVFAAVEVMVFFLSFADLVPFKGPKASFAINGANLLESSEVIITLFRFASVGLLAVLLIVMYLVIKKLEADVLATQAKQAEDNDQRRARNANTSN